MHQKCSQNVCAAGTRALQERVRCKTRALQNACAAKRVRCKLGVEKYYKQNTTRRLDMTTWHYNNAVAPVILSKCRSRVAKEKKSIERWKISPSPSD
jgi:hypothetical protein